MSGTYTAPADGIFIATGSGNNSSGAIVRVNGITWPTNDHTATDYTCLSVAVALVHEGDSVYYSASGNGFGYSYAKFMGLS